jgi:hypothetical protein
MAAKGKTQFYVRIQYKCRKCGEISTTRYQIALGVLERFLKLDIVAKEELNNYEQGFLYNVGEDTVKRLLAERIALYKIHLCADDSIGLCDVIGAEKSIELPIDDKRLDE